MAVQAAEKDGVVSILEARWGQGEGGGGGGGNQRAAACFVCASWPGALI